MKFFKGEDEGEFLISWDFVLSFCWKEGRNWFWKPEQPGPFLRWNGKSLARVVGVWRVSDNSGILFHATRGVVSSWPIKFKISGAREESWLQSLVANMFCWIKDHVACWNEGWWIISTFLLSWCCQSNETRTGVCWNWGHRACWNEG